MTMNQQEWKPVVGFENFYEVSNLGNIRRKASGRLRHIDHAQTYPTVLLSVNGKHKTLRVHRLVAMAFLPLVDGKPHINHKNGNKHDNRVENLEWVSQAENNLHAYRILHRRPPMEGTIAANRIVNDNDVPVMHRMNISGMTTDEIGELYGVCGSTIRKHLRKFRKHGK